MKTCKEVAEPKIGKELMRILALALGVSEQEDGLLTHPIVVTYLHSTGWYFTAQTV